MADLDEWEKTHTVRRTVLSDDQSGGFLRRKATNFGSEIEADLDRLTWEHLRNGVSYKSWDRASFFSFEHAYVDSTGNTVSDFTFANMNLAGLGVSTNTIQDAQLHYARIKSDQGNVLGKKLTHVVTKRGTDNALAAREIANSTFTVSPNTQKGSGSINVFEGMFTPVEIDYGLGDSEWFALSIDDGNMLPITMLSHSVDPGFGNMQFTILDETSDNGFWRNELAYGLYGRFGWNPGDHRSAFLYGHSSYTFTADDLENQEIGDPNANA